eukprot:4372596-Amphidinium_carterae.1
MGESWLAALAAGRTSETEARAATVSSQQGKECHYEKLCGLAHTSSGQLHMFASTDRLRCHFFSNLGPRSPPCPRVLNAHTLGAFAILRFAFIARLWQQVAIRYPETHGGSFIARFRS